MAQFIRSSSRASVISQTMPRQQRWFWAGLQPKHLIWGGILASIGWGLGWVPELKTDFSQIRLTSVAHAQSYHPKFSQYQKAIREIEPLRQRYWEMIQTEMAGKPMPYNKCKSHTLPPRVKTLCREFYDKCDEILRRHGLTRDDFNDIRRAYQ